jgi:hypothetical protein
MPKSSGATILATLLITACAAAGGPYGGATRSWDQQCYPALRKDVAHLAGQSAIDCGFIQLDASETVKDRTVRCAGESISGNLPFEFGYRGVGDDSWYCDVAIRAADGQLYSLYYDSDVTGHWAERPETSRLWLQRCKGIRMLPGTSTRSFFALDGCEESPRDLQALISARAGPG